MLNRDSSRKPGSDPDESSPARVENRLRTIALVAAMVIGAPLLLAIYGHFMFGGLVNADALDFAQLGRNLSAGRGFVTYILRPLALEGDNPLRQPEVTHGPLYPVLLALAFGAVGVKDAVVAGVSGLFYLLTIPVLYLLGTRVANRTVGVVTALIFAFNALMLEYALSGLHITLYIFLMSSLLLTICSLTTRGAHDATDAGFPKGLLVLAGALTALLYLTDPVFFWIVPVIAATVVATSHKRRALAAVWFAAPLCLLMLPWMARNALVAGNPLFGLRGLEVWMHTSAYAGFNAYRMMPEQIVVDAGIVKPLAKKLLLGINQLVQAFPQFTASWVLAFFLPSLFFRFSDPAVNVLRRVLVISFLAVFAGSLLFGLNLPLLVATVPVMLVFAVAFMLHLMKQAQLPRSSSVLVTVAMAGAVLFPLANDTVLNRRSQPLGEKASAEALREMSGRDEVSFSDQPWIVAWYADRPSVWIPFADDRVQVLRERFDGARWLFLTRQARGLSGEWQSLYNQFVQWNVFSARVALARPGRSIPPLQIDARAQAAALRKANPKAEVPAIVTALDGFVSVPPVENGDLTAVLAAVPVAGNKANSSNVGRRPAPKERVARR